MLRGNRFIKSSVRLSYTRKNRSISCSRLLLTSSPPFSDEILPHARKGGKRGGGDAYLFSNQGTASAGKSDTGAAGQESGLKKPEHRGHVGNRTAPAAQHHPAPAGRGTRLHHRRALCTGAIRAGQRIGQGQGSIGNA